VAAASSTHAVTLSANVCMDASSMNEVRAGTKRRLARSDDRASDCAIAGNHLDDIGKLIDDVEIDDIHRTAGRVPSDKHDAVCIDIELEIDVSHGTHSASVASSAAFRVSLARLA